MNLYGLLCVRFKESRWHHFAVIALLLPYGNLTVALEISDQARLLAERSIIVDTHIDLPIQLKGRWEDAAQARERGEFDLPRALIGHLNVPFMSIFVPARFEEAGGGDQYAHEMIDAVEAITTRGKNVKIATSVAEVRAQFANDDFSLALGMENGTPLYGDLQALKTFYGRGIRYITLTHSKSNHICDSSYDDNRPWQGLSPFGKELIGAMNNIGMMIDVSHISDQAFEQVMELSRTPVIASHSSARHFIPGFERNMSDDMIKRLAAGGGVIHINYGSRFLTRQALAWREAYMPEQKRFLAEHDVKPYGAEHRAFMDDYRSANPYPYAQLSDVLDHIDHVVALVGIDYVGIGSDYDGVGDSLPTDLKDVTSYPALVQGLMNRGYPADDIQKILGENLLRVWSDVEAYSQRKSS